MLNTELSFPFASAVSRILLDIHQAAEVLNLPLNDLEWLVSTRQLNPIVIRGKRLFLRRDLEALVTLYQSVQNRHPSTYDPSTEAEEAKQNAETAPTNPVAA